MTQIDGPALDDLVLPHVSGVQRAALAVHDLDDAELIQALTAIEQLNCGEYLGNIRPVLESTLTELGLTDIGGCWG